LFFKDHRYIFASKWGYVSFPGNYMSRDRQSKKAPIPPPLTRTLIVM